MIFCPRGVIGEREMSDKDKVDWLLAWPEKIEDLSPEQFAEFEAWCRAKRKEKDQ
jgi:hypothetical protein